MPRLLKRFTLAFAVLSVGLLLAAFIALRVVATNLIKDDTEPVRAQLVADWAKNADALEAQLGAVNAWSTPSGTTPPETGCQLRWAGESDAVQKHLARCAAAQGPIAEETLAALDALKDQLLVEAERAPVEERDFGWMSVLHGKDDWSQVTGTPLEFFDVHDSAAEAPTLALRQVRGLGLLRLLQGQRTGALDAAASDVTALGRSMLGRPFLLDQLVGIALLERARAVLSAAGRSDLALDEKTLQNLRGARLASAMLWHPWVPKAQRERFLPKLTAASRCAAASEALLTLEIGPPLSENYPEFASDLAAWKKTSPCSSEFITTALAARDWMPEGSWKRLLRMGDFVQRAERNEFFASLLVRAIESSALGRRAVTELILSVTVAKPFAAPAEAPALK